MNEEVWAGVVAFLGAVAMFLGKFRKNGKAKEECTDHGNRISVVETKVQSVEAAVVRIEAKQETNRKEAREGIQGIHERLDKLLDSRGSRR